MSQNYEYFGKYILLEKLAMGGMAEVWLARAPQAGGIAKFVAIKKILPQYSDNPEFIQMFKDEAKIAMNLSHSNIVSIYEYDQEKNQLYLVMDYVEGRNLRQILNKIKGTSHKLSISQIVYIVKEVAAGLDHAHRCLDSATGKPLNITHRDMSPQNIMISFEGEVKIVDFGIAKAESQMENTKTGTLKGKFGYMSPEQAEGQATDLRTDIFSLGIVLWELLANDRLFIANNEINTLRKIRECQVPSLTKINPAIHPELERIANKALTRDRNLRYQTAAAMHRDLSRFLNKFDPEFTPHDFAVFIKTLYTDEILETRRKLMEYSKVPARNEVGKQNFDNEKTMVTSFPQQSNPTTQMGTSKTLSSESYAQIPVTITQTETLTETDTSPGIDDPDKTEITAEKVDSNENVNLAETLSQSIATVATPTEGTRPKPQPLNYDALGHLSDQVIRVDTTTPAPSFTTDRVKNRTYNARPTKKRRPAKSEIPTPMIMIIAVALMIGTYVVFSTFYPAHTTRVENAVKEFLDLSSKKAASISEMLPKNPAPQPTDGVTPLEVPEWLKSKTPDQPIAAKKQNEPMSWVVIQSRPSGAEIFIDGQPLNEVTPARIEVPAERAFTLKLKKDRYIDYESKLTAARINRKFEAVLQRMMVAYVDIIVQPSRPDVRVYVNNQPLVDETLPLSRYAIPAKTDITIRAEVPAENIRTETTINLREEQRQTVILKLNKR